MTFKYRGYLQTKYRPNRIFLYIDINQSFMQVNFNTQKYNSPLNFLTAEKSFRNRLSFMTYLKNQNVHYLCKLWSMKT